MTLDNWAIKWGVSTEALTDLRAQFGIINMGPIKNKNKNESEEAVKVKVRLETSRAGGRLWRNNVGACYNNKGRFIRFGLANESKNENKNLKSSDLIGLLPITIQPHHIGHVFGQFLARETKPENWVYTGTTREIAQLKFLELITSLGGDACFATDEGTLT